mmetsp:Transcript_7423/g.17899  ORF Transcript_7423/g.17899 Transcript_7423/m.17899 type:complete len:349 (-) Transcript_7423:96-1142(-)
MTSRGGAILGYDPIPVPWLSSSSRRVSRMPATCPSSASTTPALRQIQEVAPWFLRLTSGARPPASMMSRSTIGSSASSAVRCIAFPTAVGCRECARIRTSTCEMRRCTQIRNWSSVSAMTTRASVARSRISVSGLSMQRFTSGSKSNCPRARRGARLASVCAIESSTTSTRTTSVSFLILRRRRIAGMTPRSKNTARSSSLSSTFGMSWAACECTLTGISSSISRSASTCSPPRHTRSSTASSSTQRWFSATSASSTMSASRLMLRSQRCVSTRTPPSAPISARESGPVGASRRASTAHPAKAASTSALLIRYTLHTTPSTLLTDPWVCCSGEASYFPTENYRYVLGM